MAIQIDANVILALFNIFAPIVSDLVQKFRDRHDGEDPTPEELRAEFLANIDQYIGEGLAWQAAHPLPPKEPL
jgi:hypothetical protein